MQYGLIVISWFQSRIESREQNLRTRAPFLLKSAKAVPSVFIDAL